MEHERRREPRRDSDRVLGKILEILRVVERMSAGEDVDFTESYADLVGLKDQVGRRQEDRRMGEALCATIGNIANHVIGWRDARSGASGEPARKVRLTKIGGKGKIQSAITGWEERAPEVGKIYRVMQENGGVIRTSAVTRIADGYLQTQNSMYQLEVIGERGKTEIVLPKLGTKEMSDDQW